MQKIIANPEAQRRTILVPIDIRGVDRSTLAALVAMAERLESGLLGLFVEDTALVQAAALPFVREILVTAAAERGLMQDDLYRRARRIAQSTRAILGELTAGRRVECRFDSVSGSRTLSALMFAAQDVYLPERSPASDPAGKKQSEKRYQRIRLVYQTGAESARAMDIIHRLVNNGHTREVFVVSTCELPAAVIEPLQEKGVSIHVEVFHDRFEDYLHRILIRPSCDLLMIPRSVISKHPEPVIHDALNQIMCPVLLVSE